MSEKDGPFFAVRTSRADHRRNLRLILAVKPGRAVKAAALASDVVVRPWPARKRGALPARRVGAIGSFELLGCGCSASAVVTGVART